ncbi:Mu transposase C-terminal domain-containing protein [Thalassobium sp. R2A62]|uniref:Mu transposase C-terminal domain-containing protein n=1 Tax=Thalassobium sp. R2A62 TaxID=633131 RepID=UPI0001B1CC17|nr:Mu transposase C-terminal domain-containing protein [Thalassobium sp. R2A62]EET48316.1 transposase, putative [Thalassobium sp. R2A62]
MDLSNPTQFSQNARLAISKFDRVTIEGVGYRFHQETEVGFVFLRDDETQLAHQFSHEDMQRLTNAHRVRVERGYFDPEFAAKRQLHASTAYGGLSAGVKTRLSKREAYTQAAYEMRNEGLMSFTDVSIKANVDRLMGRAMGLVDNLNPSGNAKLPKTEDFSKPPAARTLRRWLAAVNEFGRSGLVDRIDSRGNRASNLGPEASGLMMKEVRKYLSLERPSIEQVHEEVVLGFEKRNEERKVKSLHPLTVPSRETVRRAIRALDPYQVELARNGEAAARKKFRPVMTGISVTRPLERVEIDEWTVDVITFMQSTGMYALMSDEDKKSLGLYVEDEQDLDDRKLRKKFGRWTLTAAICCATRCIVGMVLSRNPGSEAAVQLLEMITTNKGAWSDAVGALTSWDMHGTPELIVFDGGPAFKSQRFRMAVNDLGVIWEMAMNGVPENRGTIERVFRTFATDFAPRLSGHTFNSIVEKGDADPEARAALTLDDFTFALIRWVTDIYHNTPHGGLNGETPVKAWRRLSQEYGVPSSPDMEMMRLCFGQEREYVLEKTGITILGVRYQSEALHQHMLRKKPHKVDVRWHPKDIGAISVRIGKAWFEIPALDSTLDGVAAQTWLTAVRHTKSANPKANRMDSLAVREAIKAISERNEQAKLASSLNLQDWSEERMALAEKNLLAGIEFFERKEPTQLKGTLGSEIPTVEELTGAPMQARPTKKGKSFASSDLPKKPSNFTVEED